MYSLKAIYGDYGTCCYDFILGIDYLNQRAITQAASHFSRACRRTSRQHYHFKVYQSYLGLTYVLSGRSSGLSLCQQVIGQDESDGDLYLNLARAHWFLQDRKAAVLTLERGLLKAAPHAGLKLMRQQLGVRRSNPVPFLSRQHRLNQWLGKKLRRN